MPINKLNDMEVFDYLSGQIGGENLAGKAKGGKRMDRVSAMLGRVVKGVPERHLVTFMNSRSGGMVEKLQAALREFPLPKAQRNGSARRLSAASSSVVSSGSRPSRLGAAQEQRWAVVQGMRKAGGAASEASTAANRSNKPQPNNNEENLHSLVPKGPGSAAGSGLQQRSNVASSMVSSVVSGSSRSVVSGAAAARQQKPPPGGSSSSVVGSAVSNAEKLAVPTTASEPSKVAPEVLGGEAAAAAVEGQKTKRGGANRKLEEMIAAQQFRTSYQRYFSPGGKSVKPTPENAFDLVDPEAKPFLDEWRKNASEEKVRVVAESLRSLKWVAAQYAGDSTEYKANFRGDPPEKESRAASPRGGERNLSKVPLGSIYGKKGEKQQPRPRVLPPLREFGDFAKQRGGPGQEVRRVLSLTAYAKADPRTELGHETAGVLDQGFMSNAWKTESQFAYNGEIFGPSQADKHGNNRVARGFCNRAHMAKTDVVGTVNGKLMKHLDGDSPTYNVNPWG